MKQFKYTLLFFCVSIFVLSSCMEVERKIKINPDGSGTENFKLTIDKSFFDMLISFASAFDSTGSKADRIRDSLYDNNLYTKDIKDKSKNISGIEILDVTSRTNIDSSKTTNISYKFDNVKSLGNFYESMKDNPASNRNKITIIYDVKGDGIDFKYIMEKPPKSEGDTSSMDAAALMETFFKGKKTIYEIEFPYNVISSNANSSEGRTLKWEIEMDKLYKDSDEAIILEAVMKK